MEKRKVMRRLDGPSRRTVQPRPVFVNGHTVPAAPLQPQVSSEAAAVLNPIAPPVVEPAPQAAKSTSQETRPTETLPRRSRWQWLTHWTRKKVALTVASLVLAVVGGLGFQAVMASKKIVTKNSTGGAPVLKGNVDPTKLKGEGDGRINVLLLGVGGGNHAGADLSDTIMVASIDPVNKTVAMLSIPRDLYVKIPGYGYGKINAANSQGGPELAKQVVSKILDLPIHYYVQVDFSGFKQAVDSVGGVDITNTTNLYDPAYPCDDESHYCPYSLQAGQYHMTGAMALKYSRCRHGSCGNDFGRAARQQQILVALRQKALQASTLTNPVKISGLIATVGDHVRTDFQPNEMEKMAKIVKDIDFSKATNKVLDDSAGGLLVDGGGKFPGAGSILLPKAGDFDYSEIQELAHTIFMDGYIAQENAKIEVQNGTTKTGLAAAVTKQLKAYGYNVIDTTTAAEQNHTGSTVISYTGSKKPYTLQYLEQRFHTTAVQQGAPQSSQAGANQPDIVVIVGSDYTVNTR